MDKPQVRYFLPIVDIQDTPDGKTNMLGVYDALQAPSYPAEFEFKCTVGIVGLTVGKHTVNILVNQSEELGEWEFSRLEVSRSDMVITLILDAHEWTIMESGDINFDIIIDGDKVCRHTLVAKLEDESNE